MADNQSPQNPSSLDQQTLENYVDMLIKEKNSPHVTDQNRQEVKDMLLDDINDAINKKMIEMLSDPQVDELNALLDNEATDEEIQTFFEAKIPTIEDVVSQVLLDFRTGYLGIAIEEGTPESQTETTSSQPNAVVEAPVVSPQTAVISEPLTVPTVPIAPPVSSEPPVVPIVEQKPAAQPSDDELVNAIRQQLADLTKPDAVAPAPVEQPKPAEAKEEIMGAPPRPAPERKISLQPAPVPPTPQQVDKTWN